MKSTLLLAMLGAGCAVYTDITRIADAPTASILAPSEGAVVPSGRIELLGRVNDAVDPAERLYATWSLEGPSGWRDVCSGFANADGTTSCLGDLRRDDTAARLLVQDVPGFRGTATLDLSVRPVEAPTVMWVAPTSFTPLYAGTPVAVRAELTDPDGRVSDVTLRWTSTLAGELPGPDHPDAAGLAVGLLSLPEGEQTLRLTATDGDDAIGEAEVIVVVGPPNLPPVVRIDAPVRGQVFAEAQAVNVDAQAFDAATDPGELQVEVRSDLDGPLLPTTLSELGRVELTTTFLRVGAHVLTVQAIDDGGAVGESTVAMVVDRPPVLTVSSPAEDATVSLGEAFDVRALAVDENPGTDEVVLSVDVPGATVVFEPTTAGELSARVWLGVGTHTLVVRAVDGFGLATEVTREVEVTPGVSVKR